MTGRPFESAAIHQQKHPLGNQGGLVPTFDFDGVLRSHEISAAFARCDINKLECEPDPSPIGTGPVKRMRSKP